MEMETMGKVVVQARIDNVFDMYEAQQGRLAHEKVRSVEVSDATVDTGATMLSMPRRLIEQLGLPRVRSHTARTSVGTFTFGIYGPARLTVQGRECLVEAAEVSDDCPVLIGQVPLELLDFVIDPKGGRLIGNPDHGGQRMIDLL
jgi:predicted aspartyl protease